MNNFELNQNVIVVDAMGNDDIAFGDEGVIVELNIVDGWATVKFGFGEITVTLNQICVLHSV